MSSQLFPEHASVVSDCLERHKRGQLPHALLLTSDSGLGLRCVAESIARGLLLATSLVSDRETEDRIVAGTHGDYQWLRVQDGKASIGVDQVRSACDFVGKTAGYGTSKVLVIEEADRLTVAAANALLKTLEEPQGLTFILLTSRCPWLLPATVRSRCQSKKLPALSLETCRSYLDQTSSPAEESAVIESAVIKSAVIENGAELPSRRLESWIVAKQNERLKPLLEIEMQVNRVLDQKATAQELTACLMAYELNDSVEAAVQALEARITARAVEHAALPSLLTLHRALATLLQRIRNGATPARELLCQEIAVLTESAGSNKMGAVRESVVQMGAY